MREVEATNYSREGVSKVVATADLRGEGLREQSGFCDSGCRGWEGFGQEICSKWQLSAANVAAWPISHNGCLVPREPFCFHSARLFLLTWPFWGRPKWCAGLSLFLQWVGRSPMVWTSILLSSTKDNQEISINKLQTSSNVSVFALFRTSINSQSFSKIPACLLSSAVQGSPMVSPRSTIARCARPRRWPTLF